MIAPNKNSISAEIQIDDSYGSGDYLYIILKEQLLFNNDGFFSEVPALTGKMILEENRQKKSDLIKNTQAEYFHNINLFLD